MSYLDLRDHHHTNKFAQSLSDLANILQKPYSQRSLQENRLIAMILEKIPFFANYARTSENSREVLSGLSSILNCEHYPAMSVIHHHGDLAKKFMLILKGEARKYIPRDSEDIQNEINDVAVNNILANSPSNQNASKIINETFEKKARGGTIIVPNGNRSPTKQLTATTFKDLAQHSFDSIIVKSPQNAGSKDQPNQGAGEDQVKNYNQSSPAEIQFFMELGMPKKYFAETVLKFKRGKGPLSGDYFGEVGLAVNALNDATLVAWEDVYVAVIEKKDYEQVFQELIQETRDKLDFITKNLLAGFTHKSSIPFSLSFQKMTYRAGEKIFQQGMSAKGFWVIKEGDVEVYRTIQYNNAEGVQSDESPGKKKSYKALIVRLSRGQLLGEEAILGMKERVFSAVGKAARNILYYFDEKVLEQMDNSLEEVINYVTSQAKICMEGKMQRLNSSFMEAQVVLAQNENFNKAEKNKARDKIDDLLQGGKTVQQDPKKNQINSKKVARIDQSEKEAQEWNHFEKLAEVKQKVLMDKGKIDPKLLSDKTVDEDLARKGYQENPEKTNEMQIFEKKFYFPGSLYQQAVNSNHYMKKRREIIQFQYLKDHSSSKLAQLVAPGSPTFQKKSFESDTKVLHTSASIPSNADIFSSKLGDSKIYAASPSGRLNNLKLNPIDTKNRLNKNFSRLVNDDYLLGASSPTSSAAYDNVSALKSSDIMTKSQAPSYYSLSPTKKKNNAMSVDKKRTDRSSIVYHMEQNEEERRSPREETDPYASELKTSLRSYLSYAFRNDAKQEKQEKEISSIKISVLNREKEMKEKPVYGFAQLRKKGRKNKKFVTEAPNSLLLGTPEGNKSPSNQVKLPQLAQKATDDEEKIKQKNVGEMDKIKIPRSHKRFDSGMF